MSQLKVTTCIFHCFRFFLWKNLGLGSVGQFLFTKLVVATRNENIHKTVGNN